VGASSTPKQPAKWLRSKEVNWEQIERRGPGCCTVVNRTIASTIGILFAVISFAPNEACARSAGAGGATAHGAAGLGASRSINRGIGPGLGWSRFSANRSHVRNFASRRDLRFRQFWSPGVWPDGCLFYGGCYEMPGGPESYDNDVTPSGPPPAIIVLRPTCRFQPETYVVPSEGGGERSVKVIRCLPVDGFPAPGLGNTSDRAVTGDGAVR
jgi:hypothetical protein